VTTRRHVLSLAAFAALPALRANAQPATRLPVVGILSPNRAVGGCGPDERERTLCYFRDGMRALGHVEGRTVAYASRFAGDDYRRLPALAKELVALRPDVIYTHTGLSADAAATATATIPIVIGPAGEASIARLAGDLARPIRNVTGIAFNTIGQDVKCLQLLKEIAPRIARVGVLVNPDNADFSGYPGVLEAAAASLGMTLIGTAVRNLAQLRPALATLEARRPDAILLTADAALTASDEVRPRIIAWATSRRLPLASPSYRVAPAGGLFSLSTDIEAITRRAAYYVHRILNGARPADLPVELPTTFRLVVNRDAANGLGLTLPQSVLVRADEVIG